MIIRLLDLLRKICSTNSKLHVNYLREFECFTKRNFILEKWNVQGVRVKMERLFLPQKMKELTFRTPS